MLLEGYDLRHIHKIKGNNQLKFRLISKVCLVVILQARGPPNYVGFEKEDVKKKRRARRCRSKIVVKPNVKK